MNLSRWCLKSPSGISSRFVICPVRKPWPRGLYAATGIFNSPAVAITIWPAGQRRNPRASKKFHITSLRLVFIRKGRHLNLNSSNRHHGICSAQCSRTAFAESNMIEFPLFDEYFHIFHCFLDWSCRIDSRSLEDIDSFGSLELCIDIVNWFSEYLKAIVLW